MKRTILAGAAALALSGCATQPDAVRVTAPAITASIAAGELDGIIPQVVAACARGEDYRGLLHLLRWDLDLGAYVVITPTPEEFSTLCETAAERGAAL